MLELSDITLSRGAKTLLTHANARVHDGQCIGLIGRNGAGKSTLLALIRGEIDSDQGQLLKPEHWHIASVAQETPALDIPALDYVLQGHTPYQRALKALEQAQDSQDGLQIAKAHDLFAQADGYALPAQAGALLNGLGFHHTAHQHPVREFSGGWRMRLNLAQALIAPADILLLDEPTNHLDLDAVFWLQDFLRHHRATKIIIAHDRDFLDSLCEQIWHIDQQQLTPYSGNYSSFVRQHHEQRQQASATAQKEAQRRAHLQSYIDRFRAQASKAKQAQSRIKALEKLSHTPPPTTEQQYRLQFSPATATPYSLIRLDKVDLGYSASAPLLTHITLELTQHSRIGLLGRNGAGKSTLMKHLAQQLPALNGEHTLHPNTRIGYFTQHQLDTLDPNSTALAHLTTLRIDLNEQAKRDFLGGYGFKGDDVEQPIYRFSGGEKARLALALIVAQQPNLLLLDEPTNHLDIGMRDALTEALQSFDGATVLISHDRNLLRASCDQFLLIANGKVQPFEDDLDGYHQYLRQQHNPPTNPNTPPPHQQRDKKRQQAEQRRQLQPLKKALQQAEKQVETLQQQLNELEQILSQTELYQEQHKPTLLQHLASQTQLKQSLEQAEQRWLDAAQALEHAEQQP
ncbi:ABC-F family ATP-binding cassette domain-containing protein [Rappaport israeli]|uniref:ABC-F family ATP-binding cassette domain-containing protein n=1 Tax=Rappaport israeli TaxID=1839807 RepID=UPI000930A189|nr:ATP-binding cassette domain-containing protein [Rappaport israeli]